MKRTFSQKAFTLVELMVVIGIIAVLIAILLPVMRSARQAALSVTCLSNLRQVQTGIRLYSEANSGWMPPYMQMGFIDPPTLLPDGASYTDYVKEYLITGWFKPGPDEGGPRSSEGFVEPFLNRPTELKAVLGCPAMDDVEPHSLTRLGVATTLRCYRASSYAINLPDLCHPSSVGTPYPYMPFRMSQIRNSSDVVSVCDGPGRGGATYVEGPMQIDPVADTDLAPAIRHRNRFNAVFVDGHATAGTISELFTLTHFTK